ncbi:MAG: tRNA (5-methylaminomethyl-2-thiouridine)(34)-methyltransferase MnmD [Pseudomonadota bacterium]
MQNGTLTWRDGAVPVSTRFDDPYYSLHDGLAESRHVFLAGNDLPARFRDGFAVAELGFGTGLNLLATLTAWEEAGIPGGFTFTSFEAFPLTRADMARALAAWPGLAPRAERLLAVYDPAGGTVSLGPARLDLRIGDARETLPSWDGAADAWFLDGFSPARNPELWSPDLLAEVGAHTRPSGTFATYTAAGHVRRSLAAAGFAVTKTPGFAQKRKMSRGTLHPAP